MAFAAGLWGTVVRPPAYELTGVVVARPAPDMVLIRHEAVTALGMGAMEMMAVRADPRLLDDADLQSGQRVRLGVRRRDDELVAFRIEKFR